MPWTREDQLAFLLRLPWTVSLSRDADGDQIAQVSEIPFLLATGTTEKELGKDLYDGLSTALNEMLEHGDPLTLPGGAKPPWELGEQPRAKWPKVVARAELRGEAWSHVPSASAVAESIDLPV